MFSFLYQEVEIEFPLYGQFPKLPYLGMKPDHRENFLKLQMVEIDVASLFTLYRQRFPGYRLLFKIAVFGHKT